MITILTTILKYDSTTKTFSGSEKDIQFATSYTIKNPNTGMSKQFDFTNSTGPEFDPNTKWIYTCGDMTLEVCNDAKTTSVNAENYLKAKMR